MPYSTGERDDRRRLLKLAVTAAGAALAGCATSKAAERPQEHGGESKEAEVTPAEDLMQEHGVLERILLIYEETARRIDTGQTADTTVIVSAAGIVRRFVEDYHEKNEEQFVFPRLQAAQQQVELVATLLRQHQRGREVTDQIVRVAAGPASPELAQLLRSFSRMYRPHAAREDTVLFPAFRELMGKDGYRELGEQFEDKEHALFGEGGFERTVKEVAQLEAALGIADLASFTPA